jgi:hypothetical protein
MPRTIGDVVRQVATGVRNLIDYLRRQGHHDAPDGYEPTLLEVGNFTFHSMSSGYLIYFRSNENYIEKFKFNMYGGLVAHDSIAAPYNRSRPTYNYDGYHLDHVGRYRF